MKIWDFYYFSSFNNDEFHWYLFSRVFKILQWFLVQKKTEYPYFEMQKCFTPSLVFYPTFLFLKFAQISCSQLIYAQLSMLQKWGKKLVRGVKNFWIVKYDISAFFCTKNYVKILKTRENRFTWKLEKIEMFFGWKQKFEKISFFWSRNFFSHFFPIFK